MIFVGTDLKIYKKSYYQLSSPITEQNGYHIEVCFSDSSKLTVPSLTDQQMIFSPLHPIMPLSSTFPPIDGTTGVVSRRPPTPDYVTKIRTTRLNKDKVPIQNDATSIVPDQHIIDLEGYSVDESDLSKHFKLMDTSLQRIEYSGLNKLIAVPEEYEYDFAFLMNGTMYSTSVASESVQHSLVQHLLDNNWLAMIKAIWSRITHELDRLYPNKSDCGHTLWAKVDESHPNLTKALDNFNTAIGVVRNASNTGNREQIVTILDEYLDFILVALSSRYVNPPSLHYTGHRHVDVVIAFLGTILNISQNLEYGIPVMKEKGVTRFVTPYRKSSNLKIKTITILILSYFANGRRVGDFEAEELTEAEMAYLINNLQTTLSCEENSSTNLTCPTEVVKALSQLASVDGYKAGMVSSGVIPLLIKCLDGQHDISLRKAAANTLWALAFHDESRQMMKKNPECVKNLQKLIDKEDTRDEAIGALWKINVEEKHLDDMKKSGKQHHNSSSDRYIMISYEWSVQAEVKKLKEQLEKAGFNIWIDTEQMNKVGNVLDGMASAVENADAVIVCLTERYKERNATRSEAEYAWKLEKKFFPVRMQPKYTATGWLSLLLGATFWYDLTKADQYDQKLSDLKKALGPLGQGKSQTDDTVLPRPPQSTVIKHGHILKSGTAIAVTKVPPKSSLKCAKWSVQEVKAFFKDSGFSGCIDKVEMTGDVLAELILLKYEIPETYYKVLKDELGLSWLDALRFNSVIATLLPVQSFV